MGSGQKNVFKKNTKKKPKKNVQKKIFKRERNVQLIKGSRLHKLLRRGNENQITNKENKELNKKKKLRSRVNGVDI